MFLQSRAFPDDVTRVLVKLGPCVDAVNCKSENLDANLVFSAFKNNLRRSCLEWITCKEPAYLQRCASGRRGKVGPDPVMFFAPSFLRLSTMPSLNHAIISHSISDGPRSLCRNLTLCLASILASTDPSHCYRHRPAAPRLAQRLNIRCPCVVGPVD